jgi:hypothetical protein
MVCGAEQPVAGRCGHCSTDLARYFCAPCKLFDDDEAHHIYHCPFCNLCRRGQARDSRGSRGDAIRRRKSCESWYWVWHGAIEKGP